MKMENNKTIKDIIIIIVFLALVVTNIVYHIVLNGFEGTGTMIEETILIMLSFIGLVEISSNIGWNIFVPDFFILGQTQKREEEIKKSIDFFYQGNINFLTDYSEEQINFLLSQLGISKDQLDKIRLELIKMRCIPLKNLDDAREKIEKLVISDYPVIIDQNEMDSSKVCYTKVTYYINTTDIMFMADYARELSSILSFLITEKADLPSIDKLVIPHDSNFMLGIEVGKRLGKPVVKMRSGTGKIEKGKCWEGNLDPKDRVIIVHDILVTADQIVDTLNKLPETCSVLGLYCLIVRKEWNGLEKLKEKSLPVNRIVDLDDTDIRKLRNEQ